MRKTQVKYLKRPELFFYIHFPILIKDLSQLLDKHEKPMIKKHSF